MILVTTGLKKEVFSGGTCKDVVYQMMSQDYITVAKTDYMEEVRERLALVYNVNLSFDVGDYDGFIAELVKVGMVEVQEGLVC